MVTASRPDILISEVAVSHRPARMNEMADFDSYRVRRMVELMNGETPEEMAHGLLERGLTNTDIAPDYLAARVAFRQMRTAGAIAAEFAAGVPDRFQGATTADFEVLITQIFEAILDGATEREILRRAFGPEVD